VCVVKSLWEGEHFVHASSSSPWEGFHSGIRIVFFQSLRGSIRRVSCELGKAAMRSTAAQTRYMMVCSCLAFYSAFQPLAGPSHSPSRHPAQAYPGSVSL